MHRRSIGALGIMLSVFSVLVTNPPQAQAVTVYTYTGNNFTSVVDSIPMNGSYDTTLSVTATLVLAQPLAPNLFLATINPDVLSFSFFDGRNMITNNNATGFNMIFSTNASGTITEWYGGAAIGDFQTLGGQQIDIALHNASFDIIHDDEARMFECIAFVGQCLLFNVDSAKTFQVGTWSVASDGTTVTPLPAALPLFASGLGALGLLGWRRKKKAALAA